jgi:hypothetical protein
MAIVPVVEYMTPTLITSAPEAAGLCDAAGLELGELALLVEVV